MSSFTMRSLLAAVALMSLSTSGSAETFFVDCNLKGVEKMSPEQANKVFWNRLANNGGGNAGESVDILVDLLTGNVTVTCTKTADEDTPGRLMVQIPGGPIIDVGPYYPEADASQTPTPP